MERTHRIMFVCHGNICRSPMAEFLLKDMIKKEGLADRFVIASAGTSREEIGNPVHQGTRKNWRRIISVRRVNMLCSLPKKIMKNMILFWAWIVPISVIFCGS